MTDLQNADDKLSQAPGVSNRSPFPTELLHFVPTEKRAEFLRAIAAYRLEVERVEQYSGPIPHPFVAERYEATLAGSTDRILKMAEERQQRTLNWSDWIVRLGQRQIWQRYEAWYGIIGRPCCSLLDWRLLL